MEEIEGSGEPEERPESVRSGINLAPRVLSVSRYSPPSSPPFRVLSTSCRRGPKDHENFLRWIISKRFLPWLITISIWSYVGFHIQSQWTDQNHENGFHIREVFDSDVNTSIMKKVHAQIFDERLHSISGNQKMIRNFNSRFHTAVDQMKDIMREISEMTEGIETNTRGFKLSDYGTPQKNTSFGRFIGPFQKIENNILGWNREKSRPNCDGENLFAQVVRGKSFLLIFHELSMTGAPLSMMELAVELSSCGGKVTAVTLSLKGGLMKELSRHGIKVLKDKRQRSYNVASRADFVIAGSAVCASWIEKFLLHDSNGGSRIIWWIMENRKQYFDQYFDRSKHLLSNVKMIMFLSQSQSKQWLSWCEEEKIQLHSSPELVPLSLNDELAYAAGLPSTLKTPSSSVEKMMRKRIVLRDAIRREMGLGDHQMLVITLSSINPGKGQYLLLQSASLLFRNISGTYTKSKDYTNGEDLSILTGRKENSPVNRSKRALFHALDKHNQTSDGYGGFTRTPSDSRQRNYSFLANFSQRYHRMKHKKVISESVNVMGDPKILIGSLGCKSNKAAYIKSMIGFLSGEPELTKAMLWTPTTTNVASLYAAADVYVMNAQGCGETFGRVTIEAMAFGLPILGTDAGGTREIVEHNVNGLLHPPGHKGVQSLAHHLRYLSLNPSARHRLGDAGREKVLNQFLKTHMYQRIAEVLQRCMRTK